MTKELKAVAAQVKDNTLLTVAMKMMIKSIIIILGLIQDKKIDKDVQHL